MTFEEYREICLSCGLFNADKNNEGYFFYRNGKGEIELISIYYDNELEPDDLNSAYLPSLKESKFIFTAAKLKDIIEDIITEIKIERKQNLLKLIKEGNSL